MDAFAFGQMYIYWLGLFRRKTASRITYSRRRYIRKIFIDLRAKKINAPSGNRRVMTI